MEFEIEIYITFYVSEIANPRGILYVESFHARVVSFRFDKSFAEINYFVCMSAVQSE